MVHFVIVASAMAYFFVGIGFIYYAGYVTHRTTESHSTLVLLLVFWPVMILLMFLMSVFERGIKDYEQRGN